MNPLTPPNTLPLAANFYPNVAPRLNPAIPPNPEASMAQPYAPPAQVVPQSDRETLLLVCPLQLTNEMAVCDSK
jgi:hypothetical protein